MKDNESKRLLYKPVLEQQIKIDTTYNGGSQVKEIKPPSKEDHIPPLTNILQSYTKYSKARSLKQANQLFKNIEKHIAFLRNKLLQDQIYAPIINAYDNGDTITLDKSLALAENIDGDILVETYPILENLRKDIKKLIDTISNNDYNGSLDFDEIDRVIANEDKAKRSIVENERANVPINYKAVEIDTQIAKFIEDRVILLSNIYSDIVDLQTNKPNTKVLLPKNSEFIKDYFGYIFDTYSADKDRMECFTGTDAVTSTLNTIYTLKGKVLRNRQLLAEAERDIFFGMLPLAKEMERQLFKTMVDLYKAQIVDEMNKGDYINSLSRKHDIREFYKSSVKDE